LYVFVLFDDIHYLWMGMWTRWAASGSWAG
jgi:hypothetical protein